MLSLVTCSKLLNLSVEVVMIDQLAASKSPAAVVRHRYVWVWGTVYCSASVLFIHFHPYIRVHCMFETVHVVHN